MKYKLPKGLFAAQGRVILLDSDKIVVQQIGGGGSPIIEKVFKFVSLVRGGPNYDPFVQEMGDEVVDITYEDATISFLVTVKQDIDFVEDKYVIFANKDVRIHNNDDYGFYCNIDITNTNLAANQFRVFVIRHEDSNNNQALINKDFTLKIFKMEEV